MKITRILPKFLAKTYQAKDLRRAEIQLQYYQGMTRVLEERVSEGREELERLKNEIFKIINMKNINQGISTFNKLVQDFGDSMEKMTGELSYDIEKSNEESKSREKKNQENLDKIWGKKK